MKNNKIIQINMDKIKEQRLKHDFDNFFNDREHELEKELSHDIFNNKINDKVGYYADYIAGLEHCISEVFYNCDDENATYEDVKEQWIEIIENRKAKQKLDHRFGNYLPTN
ncbi:hypothetical protein WR164_13700 [Philodulcilactobacillus myokoensis]|uniref:Uncharacterized protein n=1 Tax=Philodulcilactobacillus myokoensis TaxID=2929573 RepID=A0A9W6EST7_9LACO|nr:hypothetical protein [Philodulcilactobacillus myokoensis]GLB47391.1 hypothetical protein WR164_13700 [Philodulcilactobacillus myokoensis]